MIEEKDVDIINLSLGGEFFVNTDLMNAFESYASDKLFIAAAGNKGNVGFTIVDMLIGLQFCLG